MAAVWKEPYNLTSAHFSRALWKVTHAEDKELEKETLELQIWFLEQLGWQHWATAERARLPIKFPPAYPLF